MPICPDYCSSRPYHSIADRRAEHRGRDGFALLITIVLLAFLVLLLVGLASLTRVETQVAANGITSSQARQNALGALSIALGQLQKYAGPDQRATARADLVSGIANPYYTGVWDATATSPAADTPLVWLVSGNENNPRANRPDADLSSAIDAVLLVDRSANSESAFQVRVRKQAIIADNIPGLSAPAAIGHFAYWIGDEGIKARANLIPPWPSAASAGAQRDREAAYAFGTAQRTGIEHMAREANPAASAGTLFGTDAYPPDAANIRTVLSPRQLPLALPAALDAADKTAMRSAFLNRFHDLTTHAASVLADPRRGGLKKDLTRLLETNAASAYPGVAAADADYLFPVVGAAGANYFENPPTWGRLRSFATHTSDGTAVAPRLPSATDQGLAPVLAWVEIGYAAASNPAGTRVRMHLFPRVLLWNPYNVPLADAAYEIGFRGHPAHFATIAATGTGSGSAQFSVGGGRFTSGASTAFLRFRIPASGAIPAGGCQIYTLATNGNTYDASLAAANILAPGDRPSFAFVEDGSTPFTLSATATPLRLTQTTPGVEAFAFLRRDDPVATALSGAAPPPQNYQFIGRVGVEVFGLAASSDVQGLGFAPDFRMSVRPRLAAENNAFPMRWIANGNLRAPYVNRTHITADLNRYNPLYNGVITSGTVINSPQNGTRLNRVFALGGSTDDDLVLFQVPRADTPLFSVADLRHAHLAPLATAPAYAVGTSLADFRLDARNATSYLPTAAASPNGAVNSRLYDYAYLLNEALWDRYFFSTVPAGLPANYSSDSAFASLPNGRLTFLARDGVLPAATDLLRPELAAKHLLLQGGFNVNSTSVQAWRAQLASLNALPYDPVAGTSGGTALDRPFSRFNRPPGNSSQPWRGFRELTETQLNALAAAVVDQVRLRGPFLSLGAFVNRELRINSADFDEDIRGLKGALQAAIDTVDLSATSTHRINTTAAWNTDASAVPAVGGAGSDYDLEALHGHPTSTLPVSSRSAGAPGNLTQADLLAALGATLTSRSDTFTIRAYGDVQNPVTEQINGRAWCEAVVQRLPDYVNPADPAESFPPVLADNLNFGRRYTIISFRWLGPDDL